MTVLNVSDLSSNPTVAAIAGVAVGFVLREFGPKLVRAFEQRYIDPKKRHRQVFLDQANWLEERAQRLNVLAVQLRREPSFTIVAQATDGYAAFNAIQELRPQLAILDVSMPKMDGLEVARALAEAQAPTRVVFLTNESEECFVAEARRFGHGYVAKVKLYSDLRPAMSAALEGKFFASRFQVSSLRRLELVEI